MKFQSKSKKSQEGTSSARSFAFEKEDKPRDIEPYKEHMISPGSFVEYHLAVFENEEELSRKLIKNLPVMDDDTSSGTDKIDFLGRLPYWQYISAWPTDCQSNKRKSGSFGQSPIQSVAK